MIIVLGKQYMDTITEFEGVATAYVKYITGSDQVCLTPTIDSNGLIRDAKYFDVDRLTLVPDSKVDLVNMHKPIDSTRSFQ